MSNKKTFVWVVEKIVIIPIISLKTGAFPGILSALLQVMANERSVAAVQSSCTKATAEVGLKRCGPAHTGAVQDTPVG